MPFKFVFPYWTILSIIVVGGLCVFVDLWWGVKPVWKGLSWSKLSGSKSYLSKQGVDGFFWMGTVGKDGGRVYKWWGSLRRRR